MNNGGKLSNKAGPWEHEKKLWIFDQGNLLEKNSSKALTLINGTGTPGTRVVLEEKQVEKSGMQNWTKGVLDQGGWFPLKNSQYGGYLTAQNDVTTTISGKLLLYLLQKYSLYILWLDSIVHF